MTLTLLLATVLTLAEQGKPVAEIVTGPNPVKTVQFAARELKTHLDGITGGDFKIVTDAKVVNGLVLRSPSAALTLSGEDREEFGAIDAKWLPGLYARQGTLYAVYDFLERACGVVWADSSDYGTVLPKKPTLTVDADFKVKPPFMAYRGGHPIDQDRYEPLMWARKSAGENRYNALAYGKKTQKEIEWQQRLFMRRKRLGGEFMPANHSFYFWIERFWAKKDGWKGRRFERRRPGLFAQGYVGEPPQLCYMDPETIAQTVDDIGRYFTDDAFVKRFYGRRIWGDDAYCLEPMDNRSFCKCEKCTKYYETDRPEKARHSTYWFTFVNAVAKEVKKRFPDKRISTLAYMTHEGLPTNVTLEDNVLVYFCFGANRVPYKKDSIANAYKLMGEWRAAYPKQPLALWLYNTFPLEIAQNGGFHCFPGFFADAAEDEYRHFKELDIRAGIFQCGFNGEIDNYMQCAWMIDPDRKADDMLRECFSGCGKAAKPLIEFYRTVERRYCDPTLYPAECWHQNLDIAWGLLGSEEIMNRLAELMAEAERKAGTPDEKARVALFKLSVWDYMKEGYDTYRLRRSAPVPHWKSVAVPDAGGDTDKVDWSSVPAEVAPLYVRGGDRVIPVKETIRWANDKSYLYLELTEHLAPSNLVNSAMIAPVDTWEITLSHQRAQPFRHYLSAPDGRMKGLSYGEVNWRQGVWASESGDVSYGARAKTDLAQPDRWVIRYAFPLAGMLEKPVVPGGRLYVNIARVMNVPLSLSIPGVEMQRFNYSIFTLVTHTTVRTSDRWGELDLCR